MRTLHQTLNLRPHEHTGKMLHHRHTSYHGLLVVFILAGVFMVGLNMLNHAAAATFGVAATVAVPVPTSAPIISEPAANSSVDSSSLLVIGSCPLVTPQVVVTISDNGARAGTGVCDSRNDFSVPVTLQNGTNRIVAGSTTIDGQNGPDSTQLIITSSAVTPVPVTISNDSSDSTFIYADGENITWTGSIGNAAASGTTYVHVDWGDNSQSNYAVKAGPQSFSHTYANLNPHNVLISASNTTGANSSEQIAEAGYSTASFPQPAAPAVPYSNSRYVAGLYGLYLSALSVVIIIWLEAKHAARHLVHEHAFI